MCLAQGHKAVPRVRLEPTTLQSQVKHSTTEPRSTLNKKTVLKTFVVMSSIMDIIYINLSMFSTI